MHIDFVMCNNVSPKRLCLWVSHSHLNVAEALDERIINTHSLHLNELGVRMHN